MKHIQKIIKVAFWVVPAAVLPIIFHGKDTTGIFDTYIHYIAYPAGFILFIASLLGGLWKFEEKVTK